MRITVMIDNIEIKKDYETTLVRKPLIDIIADAIKTGNYEEITITPSD
ncbi:MAG: hypothetical protein ACTSWZ_00770 [Candidatus Heimdallarchaeaceae archaeon]